MPFGCDRRPDGAHCEGQSFLRVTGKSCGRSCETSSGSCQHFAIVGLWTIKLLGLTTACLWLRTLQRVNDDPGQPGERERRSLRVFSWRAPISCILIAHLASQRNRELVECMGEARYALFFYERRVTPCSVAPPASWLTCFFLHAPPQRPAWSPGKWGRVPSLVGRPTYPQRFRSIRIAQTAALLFEPSTSRLLMAHTTCIECLRNSFTCISHIAQQG